MLASGVKPSDSIIQLYNIYVVYNLYIIYIILAILNFLMVKKISNPESQ